MNQKANLTVVGWLSAMLAALSAVGPFAMDTYLPSIPSISSSFGVTKEVVQQTLTAFMVPFAFMTLWHGAISDFLGRKRVILIAQVFFVLASVGCMFAQNVEMLIAFRAMQGLCAGAGMVIGRAVVRDLFEGPAARKVMARVAIVFAIAPAVAPVVGGWLQVLFGWRSVFAFMAIYGLVIFVWSWRKLPETLPAQDRLPFNPKALFMGYVSVFRTPKFVLLVLAVTLNFSAVFVYIMSAPVFLMDHLAVRETDFLWLFGPITSGMVLGTWISDHAASRLSNKRTIFLAYVLMLSAATVMFLFHQLHVPALPWSILPLVVYVMGTSLAMPSLTIMAIDLFVKRKGLASSCQSFVQSSGSTLVTGVIAPLAWVSVARMASIQLLLALMGFASFAVYLRVAKKDVLEQK